MIVLLINPGTDTDSTAGRYKDFLAPMPPISLAYVAAALEAVGVTVVIHDDFASGCNHESLIQSIRDFHPEVIGITCVTPTATRTYKIAADIRREFPETKIIMGNIHPSVFFREILSEGLADAIALGEGERTVVELVNAFAAGSPLSEVSGIAYCENGTPVVTKWQPFVEDLDSLPFPAWHLFPLKAYRIFNFARVREPGTLVLGSRGCPFNCTFCSLKIMGKKRRRRSPENIADEFDFLYKTYDYVQPSFIDPIFPFNKKEGIAFSEEIIKRGLHEKLTWITETRVDLVDYELLAAMKRAGLSRIMYGFETGSQEGIDAIKKNFTMEQARKAVMATKKAGIQIIGFFMIGVPGETVKSINATIRFSKSLDIDFAKFTVFSPFPGTQVYESMKKEKLLPEKPQWEQFTNYPTKDNPAVFIPEAITNNDLIRLQKKAFLSFYLRPKIILRHLFTIKTLGIKEMLEGLRTLLRK